MTTAPDFQALRAERNARVKAELDRLAAEYGWDAAQMRSTHDDTACYCACTTGGPCEHRWDGAPVKEDGLWTTTCSRCGMWAFSHSMRTGVDMAAVDIANQLSWNWIYCSDMLPSSGQQVLVWRERTLLPSYGMKGHVLISRCRLTADGPKWDCEQTNRWFPVIFRVTHWMPLPASPVVKSAPLPPPKKP